MTDDDELRMQMERTIDRLAELARTEIESGRFFSAILDASLQPGGAIWSALWRPSAETGWHLAGEMPSRGELAPDTLSQRSEWLEEVSKAGKPRFFREDLGARAIDRRQMLGDSTQSNSLDLRGTGSREGISHLLVPIRHAGISVGVLETTHRIFAADQMPADSIQFFVMLCEIAADFLAQMELQQLRQSKIVWQQWDQFSQQLCQSPELGFVSAVIANDGRLLADSDRISVLIRRGSTFRLHSVSGVEQIEPRSSATRAIESVANIAARDGKAVWIESSQNAWQESDSERREIIQRYLAASGATAVGIIPIVESSLGKEAARPVAAILFDKFQHIDDSVIWRSRCESLANRVAPLLQAAVERSEIPWFNLWRRTRRMTASIRRPTFVAIIFVATGIVAGLSLIPVPFKVSAAGELWPGVRREVFASSSGIVEQILIAHGDVVSPGQPLIVISDPELETDTPRILGEIATTSERLKGIQTARLTDSTGADGISRARQLTADEEELKERLRTLEQQKQLIGKRKEALTLRSPIRGTILTWDVSQHLAARPVERGQSLLTVGDTSGPWVIEAQVAEKDAGHIFRARKDVAAELEVDFNLVSEPGQTYRGQIREISLSSELDEALRSYVRVVVAIDSNQVQHLRSGAAVSAKIRCGSKPIGYVWLRDLIDAIRSRILF